MIFSIPKEPVMFHRRPHQSRFGVSLSIFGLAFALALAGCSDDATGEGDQGEMTEEDCAPDEQWNPISQTCTPSADPDDGNDDQPDAGGPDEDTGDEEEEESDTGDDDEEDATNGGNNGGEIEDGCGEEGAVTSISGVVTIPSKELPLPDVAVYVPGTTPEQVEVGASCEPCQDELSGTPLVDTRTNVNGEFTLNQAPAGEDIPLVIEVGKWRRQVTIDYVEPCQNNEITDLDKTRLPKNRDEGDIPQFAVTTGECDALECLLRKIGIDDSEFTPEDQDGSVHLFAGRGGTNRYDNSLHDGAAFTYGWDWWDDLDNLLPYDIVVHSCECSNYGGDKSDQARQALLDFTEAGGRVFLSHLHDIWLSDGPSDFQAVANWADFAAITGGMEPEIGLIDTSFEKGHVLREWMYQTGTTPAGEFPIVETRGSIESLNEEYSQQWVWIESDGMDFDFPGMPGGGFEDMFPDPPPELVQYFSFNTPIDAQPDHQCGRVVFSDIHVSAGEASAPEHHFPNGCTTAELTPQEKALVFMLFDLSRCIIPDKGLL